MIIRINSRLGNQMFQYAMAKGMEARLGKTTFLHWSDSKNTYQLEAFDLTLNRVSSNGDGPQYREKTFRFDPDVYSAPPNSYFNGCWQSEKYFEHVADRIREDFTFRVLGPPPPGFHDVANRMRACNSIAVHVRRGDYVTNRWTGEYHGVLPMSYYEAAYQYIAARVDNPQVFIFTDDPEWCKQHMPGEVVSNPKFDHFDDMYLMSQAKHNIIANSTFSWWGAWLGNPENRIVVAPKQWFSNAPLDTTDLIPERWVKL